MDFLAFSVLGLCGGVGGSKVGKKSCSSLLGRSMPADGGPSRMIITVAGIPNCQAHGNENENERR